MESSLDSKELKQLEKAISEQIEDLIGKLALEKPKRFLHEEILNFTSNLSTEIGSGAFGNVYKGQFPNGVEIAVKVLREKDVAEEMFMAEMSTMGRAYHQNLVILFGFCFDQNFKALVYEFTENGSFDKCLYENHLNLKWEKLYDIAVETGKGLSYLHDGYDEQIIHHDIKAANVLINSDLSPKITDFGLAKLLDRDVSHLTMTRIRGTPGYAAPETWMPTSKITYKCDVYSYGMMLFEVLRRKRNSQTGEWFPKQVWEKFDKGELNEIIKDCGISKENRVKAARLTMVALWCIQFTPEIRPSMSIVVKLLETEMQVKKPPNPFLPQNSQQTSFSTVQPFYWTEVTGEQTSASSVSSAASDASLGKEILPGGDDDNKQFYWTEVSHGQTFAASHARLNNQILLGGDGDKVKEQSPEFERYDFDFSSLMASEMDNTDESHDVGGWWGPWSTKNPNQTSV